MPGPPIGGGGPAAGTTTGDAIGLSAEMSALLFGDSRIPTCGKELGTPPDVPVAGEPPGPEVVKVSVAAVAMAAVVEAGLSSERM